MEIGQIDIGEGECSAVGEVANGGDEFGDSAGDLGGRDDGRVVGASDRDRDGACNRAAVGIKDIKGEGFKLGLACCQVLNGAGDNAVV